MSDVFISYASEDHDRAAKLASALSAFGWSVWFDRKIITGQSFDFEIERELEGAKSVVVLWSRHSIASEWVRNEATVASERGVLVPALIDSVKPPLEFRRKQTAELVDWKGEPSHSGLQALCEGVSNTLGGAPRHQPIRHQVRTLRSSPRWALAATATIAVALGLGVYSIGPWRSAAPMLVDQTDPSKPDMPSERNEPVGAVAEIADLVVGSYSGDVVADSKGSSRSDVRVIITKLDGSTVRVASDYSRLGTVDVELTRAGNQIVSAGGDTSFLLDLDGSPQTLQFAPRNEVAYRGSRQE